MKQLTAFVKKEFTEVCRNNRLLVCVILFVLFGIMNPATAKITPWLMKTMSSDLAATGIVIADIKVNALSSWEQFFKNTPIAMVIFVLMFSGIVAAELQKGTLINMVTKGMPRWKIIVSKTIMMLNLWTGVYYLSYGITYFYSEYFWDNSIASHLGFSSLGMYLLGIWLISLIVLMSSFAQNMSGVALGVAGGYFVCYLLNMIPDASKYLPTGLAGFSGIPMGKAVPGDFVSTIIITLVWSMVNIVAGIKVFDKKNL